MPEKTTVRRRFILSPARLLMYLILIVGAIIAMIPFIWMLLTSIKTYGEHALREPWPKGLTLRPYSNLPETEELVLDLRPVEEGEWSGVPSSDLPLLEGQVMVEEVTAPIADRFEDRDVELPVEILILVADTDPEVEGYDTFYYTVGGSRVIQQNVVRARWGDSWRGAYFIEAPDMERWGPHIIVVDRDPDHFVVRKTWRPSVMLTFNYIKSWFEASFAKYTWNSIRLTVISLAGIVTFSVMAAYALARIDFAGKNLVFTIFLATLMIPEVVTLIPNYNTVIRLDRFFESVLGIENAWLNNWTVLTIPFFASTFSIFLLRQFFAQIPRELYDAALIDGCGHLRFLVQIVLPLSKAPLMSVIVLNGIWSWNAFLWPLIVTRDETWRPITVGLSKFTEEAAAETQLTAAGSAIAIIPILILYFFTQKQFTEGIATTGLKG